MAFIVMEFNWLKIIFSILTNSALLLWLITDDCGLREGWRRREEDAGERRPNRPSPARMRQHRRWRRTA